MKNKLFVVWLALMGLTLASWALVSHGNMAPQIAGAVLIGVAFVKVRLIIVHYMESAHALRFIRITFEAWVWLVGAMTIGLYLA